MPVRKPTVYLETSIISYLAARPSRDLVTAAHQQITHAWWDSRRASYRLMASQLVRQEASMGNRDAADRRLAVLHGIPLLDIGLAEKTLAERLTRNGLIPARHGADAVHIALCALNGVEYLLTWNCAHIANADLLFGIAAACAAHGCEAPLICTPEQLMGR